MRYGPLRSSLMFGEHGRITVDWPFCVSKRAEEYMRIGRGADREIEYNFFTVHATEAWKRSLTRHVAGEYNAFTVFLPRDGDVGVALKPSFKMFLEAHRDMPSAVERIFPQADRANLWDNNQRDSEPTLIARCSKGMEIEIVDAAKWDRFQYKRGINIDADFQVIRSVEEDFAGVKRTLFDVSYTNLMQRGKERAEFLQRA